jgi:hypothetical protein
MLMSGRNFISVSLSIRLRQNGVYCFHILLHCRSRLAFARIGNTTGPKALKAPAFSARDRPMLSSTMATGALTRFHHDGLPFHS